MPLARAARLRVLEDGIERGGAACRMTDRVRVVNSSSCEQQRLATTAGIATATWVARTAA